MYQLYNQPIVYNSTGIRTSVYQLYNQPIAHNSKLYVPLCINCTTILLYTILQVYVRMCIKIVQPADCTQFYRYVRLCINFQPAYCTQFYRYVRLCINSTTSLLYIILQVCTSVYQLYNPPIVHNSTGMYVCVSTVQPPYCT